MRLDEFYTVEDDGNCWTLTYRKEGDINPKTGKPVISTDASYHMNLKQALVAYLDRCVMGSQTAQDILVRLKEVEQRIEAL